MVCRLCPHGGGRWLAWLAEVELELRDALRRELILTERLRAELEAPTSAPPEPGLGGSYPRPTNGILVAMTVMAATFASSGSPAM
jgi:hypothetical protein